MLPPGHIAGGYLTAVVVLKVLKPELSPSELNTLLFAGAFIGFAPDLDTFVVFWKERAARLSSKTHHRRYVSHVPLVWLIAGLGVFFLAQSQQIKMLGLLIWLCSWSHFVLDSLQYGIAWLWPFSKELYALRDVECELAVERRQPFFKYWISFVKEYWKVFRLTSVTEICIISLAVVVFFV